MKYTVLSIAYPLTHVGPDAVGGSEQILTVLDRALTEDGHRSIVIAAEGSKVRGTLIPSPAANGHLDDRCRLEGQHIHRQLIAETLQRFQVDLVHMHSLDFHAYVPKEPVPVLSTLHLPPDWYPASIFQYERANLFLNCVSQSQQSSCPKCPYLLPYVSNGIDIDCFGGRPAKKDYALALGRICPEKGFHFALQAAALAGCEMVLAGEVFPYPAHKEYFRTQIAPLIDGRRQFIGPVGPARKRQLLAEARCLLIPSTVAETSSLVAMEAFAAGTPVVAFGSGALPEIIEEGRNGFVVRDTQGMAAAIGRVGSLDPETCRASARSRYSADRMVARYFDIYQQMVDGVLAPSRDKEEASPVAA